MKLQIALYDLDDVTEECDHLEFTDQFLIIHYDNKKPKYYNLAWIVSIEELE